MTAVSTASTLPPAVAPLPLRTRLAAGIGGATAGLSRRLGRGGGSVVGGRAILAVDPDALRRLAADRAVALVSGTNGKTTTTTLLRAALATAGPVASNFLGANLPPGLAAALAVAPPGAAAALEVDEAWLGRVVAATAPRAVALLNLSRDQLDRNNEVRQLAATWRRTFETQARATTVVANADDPLVVWGAGLRRPRLLGRSRPALDAGRFRMPPLRRSHPLWRRPGGRRLGLRRLRPAPAAPRRAARGRRRWSGPGGRRTDLRLSLPGRANQANAAMALTVADRLGVDPDSAASAMAGVTEVVGRYATVQVGAGEARLLLAKNPAGWLEVFDVLRPPPLPVVVAINARIADGRDPSWLWDVPFERLAGRLVVASGERARDLAVRLRYAAVEHRVEPDPVAAITAAGARSVDVVANYTSFQTLRTRLA